MTSTGRELIDVLERVSTVEWFRYTNIDPDSDASIPVVVWRFGDATSGDDVKKIVTLLFSVISRSSPDVEWTLSQCGQNWVLAPSQVHSLEQSGVFRTDGEVMEFLAKREPGLASRAHNSLLRIAKELEKNLPSC